MEEIAIKEVKRKTAEKIKTIRKKDKVGRNKKCPCDSGKKYKKCCWLKERRGN